MATAEDGNYASKGHSAKEISAAGKKDLANAYALFLVWPKLGELECGGQSARVSGYCVMQ